MESSSQILVVGAGGLGREVLCLIRDINRSVNPPPWKIVGFLDSGEPDEEALRRLKAEHLGSNEDRGLIREFEGSHFVVAIGSSAVRRRVFDQLHGEGLKPATLVHPTVVIGDDVRIEQGVVICAGSVLTTNISIARGVLVDRMCTVGHDCNLEEFATLTPSVCISGNCVIGANAYMGTKSCTIQGVAVGAGATIGAGAVVTRGVPSGVTAVGVPAQVIKSPDGGR